ncbi:hypothetical protein E1A91_A05G217000v1 [Gossypium mustelinum]|uniref:Cold regulated protein 27 n=4 Tax=Gossypium TaxID=3633 RepID=A0A5J5VRZ9_GOSBA|nr:hypothetical protein ES319_A05G211600v1 [Gossypium barbadense]TYH17757.1 hypothetical protein ES288_A05G216200v1 [Gossypium darwinii]TYJ35152.1 hypothetical protein E1A91_A05G217000v1 [Gossypium mustelinum]KAB2082640.1 hypothetical protein ES319_A05G211600v1 [Gossypium barbadense]KAB2082641.1 hypothetical protein ES319_A05G211600v1 [Gossypium barbadense]
MEGMNRIEPRRSLEASPSQLTSVNYIWSSVVAETTSNEWTDEKHSLYLNSMEASFINQLYDSVNLVGWNSQKEKLERPKSSRQIHCTSSGQFKVLRGGCWKKINFERPGFQPNKTNGSRSFVGSPCIQQFRSGSKSCVLASSSLQGNASTREVSDQNFVDEEKGEKASNENVAPRS